MRAAVDAAGYVELIKLFNVSLVNHPAGRVEFIKLQEEAMKRGYVIHPDAHNVYTEMFINTLQCNYNSTFYKTFEEVTSKTRLELLVDQLLHYMTTYGTDFSLGNGYVPNSNPEDISYISLFRDYKVIMPCTEAELYEKCMGMVTSGIALKRNTLIPICSYIAQYVQSQGTINEFDISVVVNREAVTMLCDMLGIAPTRKFDLLRYIIYKTTGDTAIIKNSATIHRIKTSRDQFDFTRLNDKQINALASIFYRFKPLFLAFKKQQLGWKGAEVTRNAPVINKIRRQAVTYHTPMTPVAENIILSQVFTEDELLHYAASMNIYQVVRLCNTCIERLNQTDEMSIYLIRNGKIYAKKNTTDRAGMHAYYVKVFEVFYDELRCRLSENACYIKFNHNLKLAVPTSEKNFVGDIPFGTSIDIADHAMIGIYWRNEWGTRDFDLSMIDIKGNKIGWNSSYYNNNNSVIYSGDMTNAQPEATEILYYKKTGPKGFININRFRGNDMSKYKVFVANEAIDKLPLNYMVDPTHICFEAMCESSTPQQIIGLVTGDKFVIMNVGNGYSQVSRRVGNEELMFKSLALKANSFISMHQLLLDAGYIDVDTIDPEINPIPEDAKILDLTTLSRDTLISIMDGRA